MLSISSLLLGSIPKWVFIETYLAVPTNDLPSLYGICWKFLLFLYLFDKP